MIVTAKYNMLYPPLLARIYAEEKNKDSKDPTKAAKTRLHQMFGAYVQGNAHKKAIGLLESGFCRDEFQTHPDITECDVIQRNGCESFPTNENIAAKEVAASIMKLHASTKERLPYLEKFHGFIGKHTGNVETIMDLGCGFNPFSVPYLVTHNLKIYYAYDIDMRTKDILNRFFASQNLPQSADCRDLIVETPTEKVDLAFMCKLVPVLEAQATGRGFELARQLDTKFLVITYPLKSLGGRNKGMGKNYAAQFEKAQDAGALDKYAIVAGEEIGNELVYVLEK